MIIAIDFDDTCVRNAFPDIGSAMPNATWGLQELVKMGHQLVLWTCRENDPEGRDYLQEAVEWFAKRKIPLVGVNERPPDNIDYRRMYLRRKLYADIYVDDAILGGFPGWLAVVEKIKWMGS